MIDEQECLYHYFCCSNDYFNGCEKCKNFSYKKSENIRKHIENCYGIIIPYNYRLIFDRKKGKFWIKGEKCKLKV